VIRKPTLLTLAPLLLSLFAVGSSGCEIEPNSTLPARMPQATTAPRSDMESNTAPQPVPEVDPLGPKPTLPPAKPYEPTSPSVFKAGNGMTVWLLERHTLPLVSATVTVASGSAVDPKERAGLAFITADMLDEGAGKRSAVDLSSAVNDLGASLVTGARMDGSYASITVLKKNWKPAFDILSDVVARPRLEPKEWKRVSDLWKNDLQKRAQEPDAVAQVVSAAVLYGPGTPYGHPTAGLIADAKKIDLGAVRAFYDANFRPDQATLVVVGDLTKDEVVEVVNVSLGAWKSPKPAPAITVRAPAPAITVRADTPRLVLVDRKDAPQSVVSVVREGVTAIDPKAPMLDLINSALGGLFSSRLNQNLREDHSWTYGAGSRFTQSRGVGAFAARASIVTEATGPAIKEMLGELEKMAASGLSDAELSTVKAQDRADLVQTYERVDGVAQRLGTLALLGLSPSFDASASRARQQATKAQLAALAAAVAPTKASIIVVGPKAAVLPQLKAIGLPDPEIWDAEGFPLKATDAPAKPGATPAPPAPGTKPGTTPATPAPAAPKK
jgi:zinc protease